MKKHIYKAGIRLSADICLLNAILLLTWQSSSDVTIDRHAHNICKRRKQTMHFSIYITMQVFIIH